MQLGDEAYKLFLNTERIMDDVSADLKAFLDYTDGRPSNHEFIKELSHEVALAKQNKK